MLDHEAVPVTELAEALPDLWELDRLHSLRSYGILDTAPEMHYDELVHAAMRLCESAGAVIGFVDADRTWLKASDGLIGHSYPRGSSLCAAVVALDAPLVIPDLMADPRFAEHPAVHWPDLVRAFVGVPIVGRDGLPIGAVGVFDRQAREFTMADVGALTALAELTVALLELRRRDASAGRGTCLDCSDLTPVRLRQAIENGEMLPFYQPVVDLRTGTVRGVEALVRWRHPTNGTLPPARFLPALENTDLVFPLGRHMLASSLRQLQRWRTQLPAAETWVISVNVSPGQLTEPGLTDMVVSALIESQIPSHQLELEITEDRAFLDDSTARQELTALKAAGVRLALDDYGTGYSSLRRLLETPLSTVKLDRFLVQGLPHDRRAAAAIRSTLQLATDLQLEVIAEGVEKREQLEWLIEHEVPLAQGFLLAHPVPGQTIPSAANSLSRHGRSRHPAPSRSTSAHHGWSHEMLRYRGDHDLDLAIRDFVGPALARPVTLTDPHPGAAFIVATASRWRRLEQTLLDAGIDVPRHLDSGRLTVLDADQTLSELLTETGAIDGETLRRMSLPELRRIYEQWGHIAAYGEMTTILWGRGEFAAALDLEDHWNTLAEEGTFSLFCGYPQPSTSGLDPANLGDESAPWARLDALHTACMN